MKTLWCCRVQTVEYSGHDVSTMLSPLPEYENALLKDSLYGLSCHGKQTRKDNSAFTETGKARA